MTRKNARITAFKLLYQIDIQREEPEKIFEIFYNENELESGKSKEYIEKTVYGVCEKLTEIDKRIGELSVDRTLDRISKIVMACTRLAVYEILYCDDIPDIVSVNEAVEIVKTFESDESAGYVNGILANIINKKAIL